MPNCGSQIILCDLPVRFDTYYGCAHGCEYCFVRRKRGIGQVKASEGEKALIAFIRGQRTSETKWCDWKIPLHWGGVSDPFQPIERKKRVSLLCLSVFAKTDYPFAFSTKATLIAEEPYLSLLRRCNVVGQVSMVSPKYDVVEPGAPPFSERLAMLEKLAQACKRLIIRVSPYSVGLADEVTKWLPIYQSAGVYGISIEGMKRGTKRPGWVKVGGDWCYPVAPLKRDFLQIREKCHELGLAFFAAENRLRKMGDSTCCCGVEGLEGFATNKANMNHIGTDGEIEYTEQMRQTGTAFVFDAMAQETRRGNLVRYKLSYAEAMDIALHSRTCRDVMGLPSGER